MAELKRKEGEIYDRRTGELRRCAKAARRTQAGERPRAGNSG
jgi:hypothetical protein